MSFSTRKFVLSSTLACTVALAGVVAYSTYEFIMLVKVDNTSQHIVEAANDLNVTLINAETGERGFIITGNDIYLQPYNQAVIDVSGQISELRRLVNLQSGVNKDINDIITLATQRMLGLADGIKIRREQGLEANVRSFNSNKGKDQMDEVRAIVAGIGLKEIARTDILDKELNWYARLMALSVVLLLVFVFFDIYLFGNYYRNKDWSTT